MGRTDCQAGKKTGTSFCVLLRQQCPLVSSSASCFLPTELMIRCFQRSLLSWLCRWCLGCGWVLSLGGRGRLRNGPAIHPTWNASPPIFILRQHLAFCVPRALGHLLAHRRCIRSGILRGIPPMMPLAGKQSQSPDGKGREHWAIQGDAHQPDFVHASRSCIKHTRFNLFSHGSNQLVFGELCI